MKIQHLLAAVLVAIGSTAATKKAAAKTAAPKLLSWSVTVRSQRKRPRLTPATRARFGGPFHDCPTAQRLA